MLTDDLLNRMSNESRADETGSSDVPARRRRRLTTAEEEEGREKEGQGSSTERGGEGGGGGRGGGGGNSDHSGGRNGRMNSLNEDLDRCLWRGTTHHHHHHHQMVPSKADALSSCSSSSSSIGRRFKPAATVAKILKDAERSYTSISSLRRSLKTPARFGLTARSERVTSPDNDVTRVNDDVVGLRSSTTPNPHGGKVLELRSQRQTEESSARTGVAGRKEGGLEPSRRQKWGTINRKKEGTEEKEKRSEERRQVAPREAENVENVKEESSASNVSNASNISNVSNVHVNNEEQSKKVNEIDGEKGKAGKEKGVEEEMEEEEEDQTRKQWEQKEEEWRRELSNFAMDFLDVVSDVAPEDKVSGTIIREGQVNANRSSINQTEPSGTVRMERLVPRPPQPDAVDLQKRLSEAVSHDRLPKTEMAPDIETRCHEQRVQHDVTVTIGSHISCMQQIIESFQTEDRDERIPEQHARETVTETEFKIASVSATYRIIGQQSPLDSLASRRHVGPLSTAVRSAEPQQLSPSSSSHSCSVSKVANEQVLRHNGMRVREVVIGDSKLRLVGNCKRTHPQPNRASILRQVAAASSSLSSFPFSSSSRSTIGSPLMVRRNSTTVARNFTPPLVLIQGPFPKDRRTQTTHYSKRKPGSCLVGNSSGRVKLHPDSILTPLKPSRPKYQKTRTFLVNRPTSINTPRGSSRRRSTSSYQSPPKRSRPTSPDSPGKRTLKELRPKWQQQRQQQQQKQQQHQKQQQLKKQQQLNRSFFIHNFCSTQINSGDDAHHHHNQPQLLQQRKAVLVHRTATRTLVTRVEER